MDLPPKIRSDYHHNAIHEVDPLAPFRRWVRPSVWIILGFIIGLMCTRMVFTRHDGQIAFNEKLPTMAYQGETLTIEESLPTANA